MPKVVGMYEKSRKGLEHNMGGVFGKPKGKWNVERLTKPIESIIDLPRYSPKPELMPETKRVPKPKVEPITRKRTKISPGRMI